MLTITNSFVYIAFLMFLAGGLLALEKYTKWRVFNVVPPLVWLYVLNMVFCTIDCSPQMTLSLPERMLARGIRINGISDGEFRFVTNHDVTREDVERLAAVLAELLKEEA